MKDEELLLAAVAGFLLLAYVRREKGGPSVTDIPPDEALLQDWVESEE